MTALSKSYPLIENLPTQMAPPWQFVNYHTLVPYLMDLYPDWAFEDVRDFVEEKTRQPIHGEDNDLLLACYNRCICLRREFEE
jgi:hypothetical protein